MKENKMTRLNALLEATDTAQRILSPGVGFFSMAHKTGAYLSAGAFIGRLRVLNSRYDIYLPAGCRGEALVDEERDYLIPVEYGQELFRLNPMQYSTQPGKENESAPPQDAETAGTNDGYIVSAFTTGIFYIRPAPDAPPFVAVGQQVEKGKALGLIEVMKTFNHIIFHGTDKADVGIVKKIYVADAAEVKSGQALFLIE
jgi:acetyl-CoA carboxylase biotin carboxyl carrier protein